MTKFKCKHCGSDNLTRDVVSFEEYHSVIKQKVIFLHHDVFDDAILYQTIKMDDNIEPTFVCGDCSTPLIVDNVHVETEQQLLKWIKINSTK